MFAAFLYTVVTITILALRSTSKGTDTTAHALQIEVEAPLVDTTPEAPVSLPNPWDDETHVEYYEPTLMSLVPAPVLLLASPKYEYYLSLSIRDLKKLASIAKIKKYSGMNKATLALHLTTQG